MMKYMRYVLNHHFVLVCLFLIGGVGLYYSSWLKTLHPPFALGGMIISVFWMLCLFVGKMATFAEAADIVFTSERKRNADLFGTSFSLFLHFSDDPFDIGMRICYAISGG